MKIHDITLTVHPKMLTYPKDPQPVFEVLQKMPQDASRTTLLHMSSHTGTHIDAPKHFIEGSDGVDTFPPDVLVGPATVLEILNDEVEILPEHLEGLSFGERVLFRTMNSERKLLQQAEYHEDFVGLHPDTAELLVERGVKLVGVDYMSCERGSGNEWPVHMQFLRHHVPIIENCDLAHIQPGPYFLIAAPLKLQDLDGSPCRVFLQEG